MKYSQKVKNDIDFGGICGCVYMYIHWRKRVKSSQEVVIRDVTGNHGTRPQTRASP